MEFFRVRNTILQADYPESVYSAHFGDSQSYHRNKTFSALHPLPVTNLLLLHPASSPLNGMDNIIGALFVIAFLMLLFVVLMCCLAEKRKIFTERTKICWNWRSHINTESSINHICESGRPERTLGNQVATGVPEIYSTTQQETPLEFANCSRIPQNSQQSLSVSVLPEIILTPLQQVINRECDSPPSYESLFKCECSDSPSPNSGVSNLNLTSYSDWSIVDSVNWVFRKMEDSVIWLFCKMDEHM